MKPTYALKLSPDGIGLWHRTGGGWHLVGEAELDDPDLSQRLEFLRRTAAELDPSGISTKLVIPNSQILYKTIEDAGSGADERSAAVLAAMEGATPYPIDQLAIDWQVADNGNVVLAAVARETLREAEAFAADYRFNAISFVAQPDPGSDFEWEPFFGETEGAAQVMPKGERVEKDEKPLPWPNAKLPNADAQAAGEQAGEVMLEEPVGGPPVDEEPETDVAETNDQNQEGNDRAPNATPLVLTGEPEPVTAGEPEPEIGQAQDDASDLEQSDQGDGTTRDETPADDNAPETDPEGDAQVVPIPDAGFEDTPGDSEIEASPVPPAAIAASVAVPVPPSAPVPSRTIAGVTDVGMSSRAQVILGLILIFLAIVLWASIFVGGKLVGYLNSDPNQPTVVMNSPDQEIPELDVAAAPLPDMLQMEDVQTQPVPISGLPTATAIAGSATTTGSLLPTPSSENIAADHAPKGVGTIAQTMARLDAVKGVVTHPLHVDTPLLAWASSELDHPIAVAGDPMASPQSPAVLHWLDDIKAAPSISGDHDTEFAEIVLAQVLGGGPAVSEMPGRRLTSREISAYNLGVFQDSPRLDESRAQIARLLGTEVKGPKVRRGGETAIPEIGNGEGAKRLASLPPRQDVLLNLPQPDFLANVVARKWSNESFVNPGPTIPSPENGSLLASLSPSVLQEFLAPDQSIPVSETARLEPDPIPAPTETVAENTEEEPTGEIVQALRPLLAQRPEPVATEPENVATETADTGATNAETVDPVLADAATPEPTTPQIDTDQAVETALAEPILIDPVSPLPARLRPESPQPVAQTATETPSETSANVVALVPLLRPKDVGNRQVASATTVRTPRIPTSADVAKQATQNSGIKIARVNLIGVFGSSSNRSALVRMSNGRVLKVKPGDRLDGGRVISVTSATLSYKKNGRTQILKMPRG